MEDSAAASTRRAVRQLAAQARAAGRGRSRALYALGTVADASIGADGAKALAKLALDLAIEDGMRKTAGGAAQVRCAAVRRAKGARLHARPSCGRGAVLSSPARSLPSHCARGQPQRRIS